MHFRLLLAALLITSSAVAQEPPPITAAEKEAALAAIKKWRSFDGVWEGELKYVAAPKDDWLKQRIPFKLTFKNNEPKVFIRQGVRDWTELGATYRVHQPDELTILIHAYGASGIWTENNVIVLTRRSEDAGDVFIQRVVNNWAGKPLAGEDLVYGDTRAGKVRRQ
jgi:hypothetical protein